MNSQTGKDQAGMIYSQSSGALLARLRPQNDNIIQAMQPSSSSATLNTLRPKAAGTVSAPTLSDPSHSQQSKVAKLRSEVGLNNISKTIATSASALLLSTNPEIKAQVRSSSPHHGTDEYPSLEAKDHTLRNGDPKIKFNEEGGFMVMKNGFIASLNMTPQQLHDLFKVPHTFFYLRTKSNASSVYSLELVSLDQVDKNSYFTLSKEGVTQFRNKLSTFTGLNQWEREYRLFHKISNINFFRIYKPWKVTSILPNFISLTV